ncbi:hypothetical protein AB1L05_21845 [Cytobacillus horneckiae]|uniref:hypothetical protein n=1 Tax=Cytobacillus horneckiae TaxID=549687 RepID=UPI0039A399F1
MIAQIFEVAGAIIASIGGAAFILIGFSKWFGKVWAEKILEDVRKKHSIEIEEYKAELQNQINLFNSSIDESNFVTKMQYEKEFTIYLEIWEKLANCIISTKGLYPIMEEKIIEEDKLEEFKMEKYQSFTNHYNDFSITITKYSPFYQEELYDSFIKLRDKCFKQGRLFKMYMFDNKENQLFPMNQDSGMTNKHYDEVMSFSASIDELEKLIQSDIRKHLNSLRIVTS